MLLTMFPLVFNFHEVYSAVKNPRCNGNAMDKNLWNFSMPQGNAIWWLAEEVGLEVDPDDSEVLVHMYALAAIFYATGGETWIHNDNLFSNMTVCHWNELDLDDQASSHDFRTLNGTYVKCSASYVGTKCTEGGSAVISLLLSKFLSNRDP